jgi:UvrD-like helicase C-terminal domain
VVGCEGQGLGSRVSGLGSRSAPECDQLVGVGDEIVSCANQRELRTTTDRWVTNGDRWTVTARGPDGTLNVASLAGKGATVLPADYVAGHVTLAYAVTAHKAQGATVDHALVVVDDATSAEHLYVGMTRGRHTNHAMVVRQAAAEHDRANPGPLEVLGAVIARSGLQISATQTLRDRLAASEDLALLWPMLIQARAHIDSHAGPDRRIELDARRDSARRYERAQQATATVRSQLDPLRQKACRAIAVLQQARIDQAELTMRRVWRRPDHRAAAEAKWRVDRWAGSLQAITSAIDDANRHLSRCEQTEHELTGPYRHYQEAHQAQIQRDRWLATHPGDVAWADDLVQRINTRTTQLGADAAHSQPPHLVELLGLLVEGRRG